jgi:WD40 repeat protein
MKLWDAENGACLMQFDIDPRDHIFHDDFSHDGFSIYSCGHGGRVRLGSRWCQSSLQLLIAVDDDEEDAVEAVQECWRQGDLLPIVAWLL